MGEVISTNMRAKVAGAEEILPPSKFTPPANAICDARGRLKPCEHNAKIVLEDNERFAELHYDRFLDHMRLAQRDWSDHDEKGALCWLQERTKTPFTLGHVRNATDVIAQARARDSLCDFVAALPEWDHVPRIDQAFVDAWGAEDTELTRAASKNLFIAMHARAVKPGCKVDTLWVFEGEQGNLKSQALCALGGSFHSEINSSAGTTDFMRELRGTWLAEFPELDSLRGREASIIKRTLSAPRDRFVEKFEKHAVSYPRRAVAVATTNEATYWQDHTGARRLIPIKAGIAGIIDLKKIEALRLQWFAEAAYRFGEGETWWEFPAAIVAAQDERQQTDPWEDLLADRIANGRVVQRESRDKNGVVYPEIRESWPGNLPPEPWISSADIMGKWLDLEPHQQGPTSGLRLSKVMKRLGYHAKRSGKGSPRGWAPDEADMSVDGMSTGMSTSPPDSDIPF